MGHRAHKQFREDYLIHRCAPEQRHGSWERGKEMVRRKYQQLPHSSDWEDGSVSTKLSEWA